MSLRSFVWLWTLLMIGLTAAIYLTFFPDNNPEKTLALENSFMDILRNITEPIKRTKLAMQEPDTEILMPVYGISMSTVSNSWGSPRSDGRSHEGQDIFAARGTPIFSGTEGYIRRMRTTDIGGNNLLVMGAGGRRYYYAHLDRFAEGLDDGDWVTTDTVLGFVGNTGNAVTTPPHLHFGMYEKRDAIDPYDIIVDRW